MQKSGTPMADKPTILVVDDRRANQLALEALLADEYRMLFANGGPEALATVQKNPRIDVILLDVQMPVMDGFQTASQIKKLDAGRDIPIIFVTAVYNEDPHIKRGYAAGGVDYFGKPFDPEILKLKLRIYATFRNREAILRQRELHIRESEELLSVGRKLTSVLESLTVGVLIADAEGRIFQTTEEASRIFKSLGPAADGVYGEILGWWDSGGKMIKDAGGPLSRALRGEASHNERMRVQCFDGSMKSILLSASPLRGLDDRLVGAVILVKDMTETRTIEEALEHRVTRLISIGLELEESAVRPS